MAKRTRTMGGLILILLGVFFLLRNLGLLPWLDWDVIWPFILIIAGIYLLLEK